MVLGLVAIQTFPKIFLKGYWRVKKHAGRMMCWFGLEQKDQPSKKTNKKNHLAMCKSILNEERKTFFCNYSCLLKGMLS